MKTIKDFRQEVKEWAIICGFEVIWSPDNEDMCIRPRLFRDGKEVNRGQPDHSDFLPWDEALSKFKVMVRRGLRHQCLGCGSDGHSYSECVVPESYGPKP